VLTLKGRLQKISESLIGCNVPVHFSRQKKEVLRTSRTRVESVYYKYIDQTFWTYSFIFIVKTSMYIMKLIDKWKKHILLTDRINLEGCKRIDRTRNGKERCLVRNYIVT